MSKAIRLDRPHSFIVENLERRLECRNYSVLKSDSLAKMAADLNLDDRAAISLALISDNWSRRTGSVGFFSTQIAHYFYRANKRYQAFPCY